MFSFAAYLHHIMRYHKFKPELIQVIHDTETKLRATYRYLKTLQDANLVKTAGQSIFKPHMHFT